MSITRRDYTNRSMDPKRKDRASRAKTHKATRRLCSGCQRYFPATPSGRISDHSCIVTR